MTSGDSWLMTHDSWFIVGHGSTWRKDPCHRVCMISVAGRHTGHSHGGQRGPDIGQYNVPSHLAFDESNESVFVVDLFNGRVTLLSPTLRCVGLRQVVSGDELKWQPNRLHLDVQRRRLYVADNEWKKSSQQDVLWC